jgi:hypothetical protein
VFDGLNIFIFIFWDCIGQYVGLKVWTIKSIFFLVNKKGLVSKRILCVPRCVHRPV